MVGLVFTLAAAPRVLLIIVCKLVGIFDPALEITGFKSPEALFSAVFIPVPAALAIVPTTGAFPRAVVIALPVPFGINFPLNILSEIIPLNAPTVKSCNTDCELTSFFIISNAISLLPVFS